MTTTTSTEDKSPCEQCSGCGRDLPETIPGDDGMYWVNDGDPLGCGCAGAWSADGETCYSQHDDEACIQCRDDEIEWLKKKWRVEAAQVEELRGAMAKADEWLGCKEPIIARKLLAETLASSKAPEAGALRDHELLRRACANPPHHRGPSLRWSLVGRVFGVGSGTATRLCKRFGLDPDESLGEWQDDDEASEEP